YPRSVGRRVCLPIAAADASKALPRRFIVPLEVEGFGVGACSARFVPHALIGEPTTDPSIGVLRLQLGGVIEVACGRPEIVDRDVAQPARDERGGLLLG